MKAKDDGSAVRVLVVEDDQPVRDGVVQLVKERPDLTLSGAFDSAEPALAAVVDGLAVDVALVDLGLPRMPGRVLIRELRMAVPSIEVVVLTVFDDDDNLYGAIRAGASGYLLKDASPDELAEAVLQVHRGGAPMSPSIARRVLLDLRAPEPGLDPALTVRERDVLELLTKGASYPEIGKMLSISLSTVQTHIRSIYRKLEVGTKAEATAIALRHGIVR